MSDTNDQSQRSKTMKIVIFVVGVILLFIIVVIVSMVIFKKLYPEGGKGGEEEGAEKEGGKEAGELMQESPESSSLTTKREKASPLRESTAKKDMTSFALSEGKGNDLSFSGLSNANKLKKSDLKEAANDVKTDMLVNMGNIQ